MLSAFSLCFSVDMEQEAVVVESEDEVVTYLFMSKPPQMPVISAATGRMIAKPKPITEKVANMESIPVCGVAIRKEATAPLEAFSFLSPMAVGITPHEQSGSGTPSIAAQSTENLLLEERYFL